MEKKLILKEVMATLLLNEIRKIPNQVEQKGSGLVVMGKKERRKEKPRFIEGTSLCHQKGHWKKDCKIDNSD